MIVRLAGMQIILLLLALGGFILVRTGLLLKTSSGSIINMTLYLFMPCNILYSFMTTFDSSKIMNFLEVFIVSVFIQAVCLVLSKYIYNWASLDKKPVLQFATVNSNSILLGAPLAESLYGSLGMSYASIYTIPARVVMWSAGLAYFTKPQSKMALIKSSLLHPCMIAVVLGFIFVPLSVELPHPVMEVMRYFGACTTPVSMMIIGITLAEVNLKELADFTALLLSVIRLVLLPLAVYGVCRFFRLNAEVTGISVLLTAMPAGATTTIMAAKYGGNSGFASKCVILSIILSFISTVVWSFVIA